MTSHDSLVVAQCDAVAQAVRQLRDTFRITLLVKNTELTNHFWMVQDQLHRLLMVVADNSATFPEVKQHHPRLVPDILDVINLTGKTTIGSLPAIAYSCRAIQGLLFRLQDIKPA